MIRCGFCSDFGLEYRFKHMTVKKHVLHEEKLLNHFDNLIKDCISMDLKALFIVGNLFYSATPKNRSINIVAQNFKMLSRNNIQVFVMPGPWDTPLYHSNDTLVHNLYSILPNVSIIAPPKDKKSNSPEISCPLVENVIKFTDKDTDVKEFPIEIFAPNSILIDPQKLKFNFKGNPKKFSIMALYGEITKKANLKKVRDKKLRIIPETLRELNKSNIDLLLLGGINFPLEDDLIKSLKYNVLICPPAVPYDFNYNNINYGLQIENLESIGDATSKLVSQTGFKFIQEVISVTGSNPLSINNLAENLLQLQSNARDGYFQIKLEGHLSRANYQGIKIFDLIKKGKKLNFYFELRDEIEFLEVTQNI
ncbi:MAG: hypothetical protein ACTSVE_04775, partial [Candidatus Helarchaeota archaeon]